MVSLTRVLQEVKCPVPGCLEVTHSAGRLCENFMYYHFQSKGAVVQEGAEPLNRCDFCGMHMPAGQPIIHHRKALCNKNTQMRWQRRDMAIADRCLEATFILTGEEEAECI